MRYTNSEPNRLLRSSKFSWFLHKVVHFQYFFLPNHISLTEMTRNIFGKRPFLFKRQQGFVILFVPHFWSLLFRRFRCTGRVFTLAGSSSSWATRSSRGCPRRWGPARRSDAKSWSVHCPRRATTTTITSTWSWAPATRIREWSWTRRSGGTR